MAFLVLGYPCGRAARASGHGPVSGLTRRGLALGRMKCRGGRPGERGKGWPTLTGILRCFSWGEAHWSRGMGRESGFWLNSAPWNLGGKLLRELTGLCGRKAGNRNPAQCGGAWTAPQGPMLTAATHVPTQKLEGTVEGGQQAAAQQPGTQLGPALGTLTSGSQTEAALGSPGGLGEQMPRPPPSFFLRRSGAGQLMLMLLMGDPTLRTTGSFWV